MRILIALPLAFSTLAIHAQDAGQMAAQQAGMMAAQQASMQAQQANQQAQQQAQQASQQASQQAAQAAQPNPYFQVAKPKFSVAGGSYATPVTLRLKDRTRGTIIYYTTDGWTPTTSSTRYTGPITLTSSATVQAVAVNGSNVRSLVSAATYTIAGAAPAPAPISATFPGNAPGSPILMPGTPLPLVFSAPVSSHGLQVGDKLPIALAQDLIVGGKLLAPNSTPVFATVTQVDPSGRQGFPGTITFEVHSLTLSNGATLFLSGTETKEGESHVQKAMAAFVIPLGGLFVRGQEAEIPAGSSLVARVEADPSNQAKLNADNAIPVAQP